MMTLHKVFLASQSPRRLELLSLIFPNLQKIQSTREEPLFEKNQNPRDYLDYCIEVKSLGAREAYTQHIESEKDPSKQWNLVVAADTVVLLGKTLFGKPEGAAGAKKMLVKMMGLKHSVLTAYSLELFEGAKSVEFFSEVLETKVKFKKSSTREIKDYVKTGEPLDKSGSYGVQGPALQFVESIEGSYASVMGIPSYALLSKVQKWQRKYQ
jgi:septum formation protein